MNESKLVELLSKEDRWRHRAVVERWIITGTLHLETPAHFGAGQEGDYTDMPLLLDERGRPLLPGTSIAGALRNALREREAGDAQPFPVPPRKKDTPEEDKEEKDRYQREKAAERNRLSTKLFGFYQGDDNSDGAQSPLVVEDADVDRFRFELRDGVAIDAKTRTADIGREEKDRGKKFDMELLAAGTTFKLGFELAVGVPRPPAPNGSTNNTAGRNFNVAYNEQRQELLRALVTALGALERGEITLGARKRRGFGQCRVANWTARRYDLTTRDGLLAWLARDRPEMAGPSVPEETGNNIAAIVAALGGLDEATLGVDDARRRVRLLADFAVESSLLVRAGLGEADHDAPDMVHLHSWRDGKYLPIVSGTSWAGVLRHRATKIARTLGGPQRDEEVNKLVDELFGPADITQENKLARASRLSVRESTVKGGREMVQTRVRIDRFTGGALDAALFDQQPLFGAGEAGVQLAIEIRSPANRDVPDHEVGWLLLLLKDLWTGDLRVGGEASVGRGVLRGRSAELTVGEHRFVFTAAGDRLNVEGDREMLQGYVNALQQEVARG